MAMQYDVKSYHASASGTAVNYRTRLKSVVVTSGTVSARTFSICDPTVNKSGTYVRTSPSGVVTITMTAHGLETGDRVFINFTSGLGIDAAFDVTKLTANTFTVTTASTASTSGNVTMYPVILLEVDTFNTVGLPISIPGEGILCENGIFVGLGGSVTGTVYYG
jgi:hypothetical protein